MAGAGLPPPGAAVVRPPLQEEVARTARGLWGMGIARATGSGCGPTVASNGCICRPRRRGSGRGGHGNLRTAVESAGARLDDVVKVTVYVASDDRADLEASWNVVHRWFGPHEPPATLLGVSVLGYPDQLFEVEAVAALPG